MGNRLSMATTAGNTSSTIAYTYDAGDRLLGAGGTTYTYDSNGNRVEKNRPNGTTSYGYDAAGRLAGVALPGSTSLTFAYDGDGNRLGKAVTSGNTTESTRYVWDVNGGLPQVLTEADGQGTAHFLYGLQRISTTDLAAGEQMYYHYDGLGSVRRLSGDGSGTTITTYSYDAFGEPDPITGQVDNEFLFTGEQMDAETGLIYLRARYYDPETGRFISRDPFTGFDTTTQSLNRYTYGYINPVRYTDPSGKVVWWVPGVAGAAVNDAWYIGEVIGTYAATGENTFSWCTLAGRTAGGVAGGYAALGAAYVTKNPAAIGAAWGAAEYGVDTYTQNKLSAIGVLGSTEEFSWEGLAVSTGGGAISGGVGKKIFSPNVGRNPKSLTTALTGRQMQKELQRRLFGNIVTAGFGIGFGIGVDSALEQNANSVK